MQGNTPIFLLAIAVLALGVIGVITTSHKPYSITQNFCVIVMVSGALMTGGLVAFSIFSGIISLVRGR